MRTFVIRLQDSRPSDASPDAMRGIADDIVTGHRTAFTSAAELLSVLAAPPPAPPSPLPFINDQEASNHAND